MKSTQEWIEYERAQAEDAWRRAEAAADPHERRTWLERAHRYVSTDQNIAFALAAARLQAGDAAASLRVFESISQLYPTREVCCGIAAAALELNCLDTAIEAVRRALATAAADTTVIALAQRVTALARLPGWAGIDADGKPVVGGAARPVFRLDGTAARLSPRGALPPRYRRAAWLHVSCDGAELLGSPIDLGAISRVEGAVECIPGGIAGWAWRPGAPESNPVLTIITRAGRRRITAKTLNVGLPGTAPLARPRGFRIRIDTRQQIRVVGPNGRDLLGSPLGGGSTPPRAPAPSRAAGTAVVIPVYRGRAVTLACIASVLTTVGAADPVLVVNDASPDAELAAALRALAAAGRITLLSSCRDDPGRNLGFPAAANAGLRAAAGRDAVLLNSDTLVFPGWLAALRAAAHSAPDIGTATPLSNDATVFSYPGIVGANPVPSATQAAAMARHASRANGTTVVEAPTGHGFCLYIRADCLHRTGLLRANLFAQGYGEENDFTERARRLGWRHVAVPGVYVAHEGGASFGPARYHLLRRNGAILDRLHPGYAPRVAAFIAADKLLPARRRIDAARWRESARARAGGAVLLIAHGWTGGTARVVRERAEAIAESGRTPVVLRGEAGKTSVDAAEGYPNLRFDLPAELPALVRLLAAAHPAEVEIHHVRDQDFSILTLSDRFRIPHDVWVHDYLWLCPRLSLVTGEGRFCGEPPAEACVPCVARWGDGLERPASAASLRAMSATLFAAARAVIVPSQDVATRLRRHFPRAPLRVRPWEPDPQAPPAPCRRATPQRPDALLRVAVVGAIGMEKGVEVLVACATDAAERDLPLRFELVGYTESDPRLLATGKAGVTGPFEARDAPALIAATGAQIGFLPSIWPETWCYALSDAWNAGLDVAVFDIGTPAERVRRTGRGWVLPLGLPPPRVNDVLLKLQAVTGRSPR